MEAWFVVKNASDEPVYQVKVTVVPWDSAFASDPEAARGQAPTIIESDMTPPLLPHKSERGDLRKLKLGGPVVVLGLSFTDSQGRRWKRLPIRCLARATTDFVPFDDPPHHL